jgi:FixJ family two-component response regulator
LADAAPLISIIDDDEELRAALVALVRSLGYRGGGFASADAFLASDSVGESACIITDIQMPGLSGIDLKHRMSVDGRAAPVIIITARTEPALLDKARASGAACVLQKPFAAEALIQCLERALAGDTAFRND